MINILTKETIDKIAAGEVAERPESVVKELVDNAIDAGPAAISIEIKDGGLSLIRVTDNGCGIAKADIPVAFVRHATSKLKTAEDIEHVVTMGFRGEALASIAAVSRVELISKTADSLTGTLYRIENGVERENKEIGAPDGTTVAVRDFLLNVPVRRQFLKSRQTENSYIITTVESMALAHPDISFTLNVEGKTVLHTSGNGRLLDIIYMIYGAEAAKNLLEVDYSKNGIHISGFAAKPVISRSKRDYELFFVNGRCIKADILAKAVEDAYSSYMMQHRFPMVILSISVKPETVDVNVHPRKTEVRFSDNALMYDVLFDALKEILQRTELIADAPIPVSFHGSVNKFTGGSSLAAFADAGTIDTPKKQTAPSIEPFEEKRRAEYEEKAAVHFDDVLPIIRKDDPKAFLTEKSVPYFKMIGQVFDTYWIIEYNNEMYLIDQHAAHEKVNYEEYMSLINNHEVTSQMLFPPIVLTLSARETVLLDKNLELFSEAGYEIEYAGDRDYIVRAVPSNVPGVGEYELLRDIIEHTFDEGGRLSSELLKEKIASMSCKAAVKGNNRLSEPEMKALIEKLLQLDNPYACPHGRPTVIKWSKYELDKLFKRIV